MPQRWEYVWIWQWTDDETISEGGAHHQWMLDLVASSMDLLAEHGRDGWEAVGIQEAPPRTVGGGLLIGRHRILLKRPINQD